MILAHLACLAFLIGLAPPLFAQAADKAILVKDRPLGKGVRCVAFSPDGTLLAGTLGEPNERGRVVLWDVATQKQLWSHSEGDGVPTVVFAPDGKAMAIGNYDHNARLLDTKTGNTFRVFKGHTNYVRAVAISPDGKTRPRAPSRQSPADHQDAVGAAGVPRNAKESKRRKDIPSPE